MRGEVGLTRGLEAVKGRVNINTFTQSGFNMIAARRVRHHGRCSGEAHIPTQVRRRVWD